MSERLRLTPGPKRHPAQAGDLIQYQFYMPGWFGRETRLSTRRVVEVLDSGASFVVEGGYQIRAAQITVHMPANDTETQPDDGYNWCGAGKL